MHANTDPACCLMNSNHRDHATLHIITHHKTETQDAAEIHPHAAQHRRHLQSSASSVRLRPMTSTRKRAGMTATASLTRSMTAMTTRAVFVSGMPGR